MSASDAESGDLGSHEEGPPSLGVAILVRTLPARPLSHSAEAWPIGVRNSGMAA
jgi:hypothetical protein